MQHTEVSPQADTASESKLWFIGKQPQVQQEKAWQQYYKPTTHWQGELWEITSAPTFFVHLQYIPVGHGNNSLTRRLWPSFSIFYFLGKRRKEYGGTALLCSVLEALGSWNSSWAALIKLKHCWMDLQRAHGTEESKQTQPTANTQNSCQNVRGKCNSKNTNENHA